MASDSAGLFGLADRFRFWNDADLSPSAENVSRFELISGDFRLAKPVGHLERTLHEFSPLEVCDDENGACG